MAYSTQSDLENQCGEDNISRWSSLNNEAEDAEKTARINWAIARADEEIDDVMRANGRYTIPLSNLSGSTPASITYISAALACGHLYESRGVEMYQPNEEGRLTHKLSALMGTARRELIDIASGDRKIDAV